MGEHKQNKKNWNEVLTKNGIGINIDKESNDCNHEFRFSQMTKVESLNGWNSKYGINLGISVCIRCGKSVMTQL